MVANGENRESDKALLTELKGNMTTTSKDKEGVMLRYGLEQIPSDVYSVTVNNLDKQISYISEQLTALWKSTSNQVLGMNKIILTSCNLASLWHNGPLEPARKYRIWLFRTE